MCGDGEEELTRREWKKEVHENGDVYVKLHQPFIHSFSGVHYLQHRKEKDTKIKTAGDARLFL